jgi:hypothetical protein
MTQLYCNNYECKNNINGDCKLSSICIVGNGQCASSTTQNLEPSIPDPDTVEQLFDYEEQGDN